MGRIAPRKQVPPPWDYRQLLRAVRARLTHADEQHSKPTLAVMSLAQRVHVVLKSLWHRPDDYRWMEPLPPFHRRWILIATALLFVALLWPYSPPSSRTPPAATPVSLSESIPIQANLVENSPPLQYPHPLRRGSPIILRQVRHWPNCSGTTICQ